MIFTKSSAYALQALIELSKFHKPVDVNKLSEITTIPKPFLAKLLQNLSKKNFIKSFKGIHGGFLLVKKPNEIKVIEIFKAMEDKDSLVFYCSSNPKNCVRDRSDICDLMPFFSKLEKEILLLIKDYTLEDIIRIKSAKKS